MAKTARTRAQARAFSAQDALALIDASFSDTQLGFEPLTSDDLTVIDLAPNAIEYCVGRSWMNASDLYEFPGSYQVIRDFFELRCPLCNPGGTSAGEPGDLMPNCTPRTRTYMESETLLRWSWDFGEEACPKCRVTKSELIERRLAKGVNQMHLLIGQRAGKSMTAAYMANFLEHFVTAMGHRHPRGLAGFLGISNAEGFAMTMLAASDVQSKDTIWMKYIGLRRGAPWMRRYVAWLKLQERAQPKFGMRPWEYAEDVKKIRNEHPKINVIINSLNSNSGTLVGGTRLFGIVDELGRMKDTEGPQSAREVYRGIEASLRTVRTQVQLAGVGIPWLGAMISVTSPLKRDDLAMQLFKQAAEIPKMMARKMATWQFNPKQPRKMFDDEYRKDPIGAERNFAANPPGAEHPFIHDEAGWWREVIERGPGAPPIDPDELRRISGPYRPTGGSLRLPGAPYRSPLITFKPVRWHNQIGTKYVGIEIAHRRLILDEHAYVMAFDPAKNFDGFSGCLARREKDASGRWVTVICALFRVLAEPGEEVHFDSITDVVKALSEDLRLVRTEWDQWNSAGPIQAIRDMGVPSDQYSLTDEDMISFRTDSYSGLVHMLPPPEGELRRVHDGGPPVWPLEWLVEPPRMSAASVAVYEMLRLQCDPDTQRVSNPNKGRKRGYDSDDTARVVAHVHHMLQKPGFEEKTLEGRKGNARRRMEFSQFQYAGGRFHPSSSAGLSAGAMKGPAR